MVCFPLNNTEYDAGDMGAFMACRTRGVFAAEGHYGVSAAGGMDVTVEGGVAWLKMEDTWGVVAREKNTTVLTVEPGHGVLDRIDAICLQLDKNENTAQLVVKKGALAAAPVAAEPRRNLYYDEIYLATVKVPAGTLELTQALITDTRMDENLCGLMRDGVTGLPTAQFQAQAEDLIRLLEEELENAVNSNAFMLKSEYVPDATAALSGGRLYITSTYPRIGTRYEVKFIAPADQGTTPVTIDGTAVTVVDMLGEVVKDAWAQGAPVTLSRKGSQAFFKTGGGAQMPIVAGGTTRPQNPAEKTIWAYGAWTVGKVFYGANPPTSAAGGDIWLLAGYSNVSFTLDSICYSPTAVMQYQGGAFVPLPATIYTQGSWELLFSVEDLQYHSPLVDNAANTVDAGTAYTTGATFTYVTDDAAGKVAQGTGVATSQVATQSERYLYAKDGTLVCAFRTSSAATDRYLVSVGNASENQAMCLVLNAGAAKLHSYGSMGSQISYSGKLSNDNQWHSMAGTVNYVDDIGRLYLDGDMVASDSFKSYIPVKYLNLMSRPGSSPAIATYTFTGKLSNAFFYTRTMGDMEVRGLSQALLLRAKGVI